jgi:lysine 6-dehydrogenase
VSAGKLTPCGKTDVAFREEQTKMKVLIAGGYGNVGRAIVMNLLSHGDVAGILVAGRHPEKGEELLRSLDSPKVSFVSLDVGQKKEMLGLLDGVGVLVNATSHEQNLSLMECALEAGAHYLDLGGMFHITRKQLDLDGRFREAGLSAVLCMGACPGLSNILAARGAERLDQAREVHIRVGSRRGTDFEGFNLSPRTLLDEFTKSPVIYSDGAYTELPPLSGWETYSLPQPVGEVEGFYALHSEVLTLPMSIPNVRKVTYWVAFPPAIMGMMRTLRSLGLMSPEPIRIKGVDISPREFLHQVFGSIRTVSGYVREFKALQVEVRGTKGLDPATCRFDVVVESNPAWKQTASAYWTAIPASIAVLMLGRGEITKRGVLPPDKAVPPEPFLAEVERMGIVIRETTS